MRVLCDGLGDRKGFLEFLFCSKPMHSFLDLTQSQMDNKVGPVFFSDFALASIRPNY